MMNRLTAMIFALFLIVSVLLPSMFIRVSASTSTLGGQSIGSIVRFEVGGVLTEFIVVHQGSPSADYVGFEGGTVLLLHRNVLASRSFNTAGTNDYENSSLHAWLNGEFINMIESDISLQLMHVRIPYRPGAGTGSEISSGANGLQCRAFILSANELNMFANPRIGVVFSYFVGSPTNHSSRCDRRAFQHGNYQLRTTGLNNQVWRVFGSGDAHVNSWANDSSQVRPALVLPNTLTVDANGRVLGVVEPPTTEPVTEPTTEPTEPPTDPTDPLGTTDPNATSAPDDECKDSETLLGIYQLLLMTFVIAMTAGIVWFFVTILSWFTI